MSFDKMKDMNKRFNEYYNEHYKLILMFCKRKLQSSPDKIDDCVQEVFIALFNAMQKGEDIKNVRGWLLVTAANQVKNIYTENTVRKNRQVAFDSTEVLHLTAPKDILQELEDQITVEEIEKHKDEIINSLSEKEQQLLQHLLNGEKLQTIAENEGLSLSGVKSRSVRLQAKIKTMVKKLEL